MLKHDTVERSLPLMVVMIVIALSWGGLAEIVPLVLAKQHHAARGRFKTFKCHAVGRP